MANYFTTTTQLLVDHSARALLLAALAALVLRFWPARNANFQHRAWTAVLWGMLLLPVLAEFTPALSLLPSGWRWEPRPVIAQSSPAAEKTIPAEAKIAARAPSIDRASEPGDFAASPMAQPLDMASGAGAPDVASGAGAPDVASGASEPDVAAGRTAASGLPASNIAPGSIAPGSIATDRIATDSGEQQSTALPERSALGWPGVILALYLCGLALFAARLALGYWAAQRLVSRATDIPRPLGCRARLATTEAVRLPVTVGLLRPVILLPADWSRWSQALLSSVVAHEQAHIDRRDHLVLLASELNRCLYWFHPVAWFLRRRLSALAEQCCDDTVIAALRSRGDYARHLLEIASRLTTHPRRVVPLGISMARSSQVESRIVAILDERRPLAGRIGRGGALALAAIVGPIVLLAAGLRAADPPQPTAGKAAAAVNQTQAQAKPEKPPVKGATVSGRVVLEADDSPVVGAEVRLLLSDAEGYRESERDMASDAQGNFVFENVPDGTHLLVAVTANMASRRARLNATKMKVKAGADPEPVVLKLSPAPSIKVRVTTQADGKPLAGAVVRLPDIDHDVAVDAGGEAVLVGLTPENWEVRAQAEGFAAETAEVRLRGTEQAEIQLVLVPGGKIHGTVKDQEGNPLARTRVNLRWESDSGVLFDGAQTDGEGRFHFDFVPLGESLELNTGEDPYLHTQKEVSVPADGDRDAEVNLVLERRPKGGSVQGLVTDQEGKPIAGASVTNGWRRSRERRETFTTAAGRFTLDDVFTGGKGTFVVVRAKGFAPQAVEFTPGPADNPAEITAKLEPGHRVRGRVVDFADKPIAGVWVSCASEGRGGVDDIGGDGRTDAGGRFEFDSLPADCSFNFWAQGYSRTGDMQLALDNAEEALVKLRPEGILRGRVINAANNEPVTKFRVRLDRSPDRRPDDPEGGILGRYHQGRQFKAVDGQFTIDDLTADCPLQVTVDGDGFDATSVRRVVPRPEDEAEVVEIKLAPTDPAKLGTFAGTIVDEHGRPTAGAQVRLVVYVPRPGRPGSGFKWRVMSPARLKEGIEGLVQFLSTVSGTDGGFRFDGVRLDKKIELVWWGEGVSEGEREHLETLSKGERTAMRIESPTPGAIQGKINRKVLPNLHEISVGGWDSVEFPENSTKDDYLIRNLRPGRYELDVRVQAIPAKSGRGGMKMIQSQTVTIESGKTTTVDIGFETDPGPGAISPASAKRIGGMSTPKASTAKASTKPQQPINEPADEEAVLTGRVVDDQGKAVPEALVTLPLRFGRGELNEARPLETKTDAAGRFTFRISRGWLPPTEVLQEPIVWAYAPGHALAFLPVYDRLEQRPPGEIELVVGPPTDTAFRIVDPQGKPVAGARVVPSHIARALFAPQDEIGEAISGTSDADGLARLPAIDRRVQMVKIRAPGFGEQLWRMLDDTEPAATTTIPLRPVGRLEVKFTGDAPQGLAGLRVGARTVQWGTPFSGRTLGLPPTEGGAGGKSNENGEFIAQELAAGDLTLDFAVAEHEQPLRPQPPKEALKIVAGQTTRVEVPLVKAQRVRGHVRTKPDGKPVPNAQVTVMHGFDSESTGRRPRQSPQHERVSTDAEGRFEAYALPGEVVLHVADLPGLTEDREERGPQREEVTAQEGVVELKPVEMVATKSITGRLVDQFDRPLVGTNVSAKDDRYWWLGGATTDSDGGFSMRLPADVQPSSYEVRATTFGVVQAEVVQRDPLVLRVRMAYPPAKKP